MQKLGNSELFNNLVTAASTVKPAEKSSFATEILEVLKTANKKPTLADIIKQAQLGQGGPPLGLGGGGGSGGPGCCRKNEILDSVPSTDPDLPVETEVTDEEGPKKMVAQALLAMWGGDVEAACECLRKCGGKEGPPEELPSEELPAEEPLPEEVPPVGGPETKPLPTDTML